MRVVAAVGGLSLLVGCNGSTPPSSASIVDASGLTHDAWVAVSDAASMPASDAQAAVTEGPDPPSTRCDPDGATATAACPSPPPACVDSHVAVNYIGGQCAAGFCVWQKSDVDCRVVDASCASATGIEGGVDNTGVDGSVWVSVSGCLLQAPAGPDPPPLACDADASPGSGVCPLPPSVCGDSQWLVYYDDGQCVAGSCTWQKKDRYCNGLGCSYGACGSIGTVPAAPTAP